MVCVRVSREVPLPEEGKQQLGQLSLNLLSITPSVPTSPFLQLTGNKVGGRLLPTCPYLLFSVLLISMNFPHIPLIDSQGLHPFYFRRQILSAAPHPYALHTLQIGWFGGLISTSCSYLLQFFHILVICCSFGCVLIDTYNHTFRLEHDFDGVLDV